MKKTTAVLSMAMLLPAIALAQRPDRGGDHNARGQKDHAWNGDRGHNQGRNDQRWTPQAPRDRDDRFDRDRRDDRRYDDRRFDHRALYDRDDVRFHLDRPYAYGRFGFLGPRFVFRIDGGGPMHFRVGSAWFAVADFDDDYASNWLWNADDVVITDDPDHVGWYLAYNTRLGTTVHVQYLGG